MGLSERKSRQRIQADPQNKTWSEDSSRFGLKLLEQMGFKQGKGLGRNEEGITTNIVVKRNVESNGIGCTAKTQDNWLENQFQFDNLLKSLAADDTGVVFDMTAAESATDTTIAEDGPMKDEKKKLTPRTISSRHSHRRKFIVQKRMVSGTTVVCDILGIGSRVKDVLNSDTNSVTASTDTTTACNNTTTTIIDTAATKTTTSSNNLQEYFAKKMAEKGLTLFGGVLSQSKSVKYNDDGFLTNNDCLMTGKDAGNEDDNQSLDTKDEVVDQAVDKSVDKDNSKYSKKRKAIEEIDKDVTAGGNMSKEDKKLKKRADKEAKNQAIMAEKEAKRIERKAKKAGKQARREAKELKKLQQAQMVQVAV